MRKVSEKLSAPQAAVFRSSKQYLPPSETYREAIYISFEQFDTIASIGASYYLRNTDGHWWKTFTDFIVNRVKLDSIRSLPRILLREPRVINLLTTHSPKKTQDALIQECLKDPRGNGLLLPWPKSSWSRCLFLLEAIWFLTLREI